MFLIMNLRLEILLICQKHHFPYYLCCCHRNCDQHRIRFKLPFFSYIERIRIPKFPSKRQLANRSSERKRKSCKASWWSG